MTQTPAAALPNRWTIAIAGTLLQLCLGTVYAWSGLEKPLRETYGWTKPQVTLTFSIAIAALGLAAAWGGVNLSRFGPRKLAMIGGALFGAGYLLGALGLYLHSLPLLYLGYGAVGGAGLGLGYVTPVATAAKWFPDKKGLVTGMVIMGFGLGALLMSKVLVPLAVGLFGANYPAIFAVLGGLFLVVTPLAGAVLRNPPAGYLPADYAPTQAAALREADVHHDSLRCLVSRRFAMMWLVFFCNIAAGIAIISLQSTMIQDLCVKADGSLSKAQLGAIGATLIAVSSLFNGAGRFFWGGLSDRIGRTAAFRLMLGTQIAAFGALILTSNPWLFGALVCYILLCYGGGFGTMPSFVLDVFGARKMPVVYGAVLTAWSAAGVAGPFLFAYVQESFKANPQNASLYSFLIAVSFLTVGLLSSLLALRDHPFRCGQSASPNRPSPSLQQTVCK
ncbi:MAG: OFA family MFS transporter [Planctomycetota bacterium]|nr:OFA family MFS transporter [Planctomycetota bacterium]